MTTPGERAEAGSSELIQQNPPVYRFTAPNAGPKTLSGTNTYTVGLDDVLLIDPGPDMFAHTDQLEDWLHGRNARLRAILLTHLHPDHAPAARVLAMRTEAPIFTLMGDPVDTDGSVTHTHPLTPDRMHWHVGEDTLSVVPAPGHTPNHICFFLERSRLLFTGDAVLGRGSTLIAPPEGNMLEFMHTLKMLAALQPQVLAPGHGPVVRNALAKIDEDLNHREQRERAIREQLSEGPATSDELVSRIYRDTHPDLLGLARMSVHAQLEKLVDEEQVVQSGDLFALRRPYEP